MARAATPAPPRRRRRPEEAEREILDAAEALLRQRPSHEVTVMAVMERTTLSRKSFYVYFRDRHELIARLVAPLREELDARFAEVRDAHEEVRERTRAILLEAARFYMAHGELLRALRESSGRDEDARRAWREFTEPPIREFASQIQAELDAGAGGGARCGPNGARADHDEPRLLLRAGATGDRARPRRGEPGRGHGRGAGTC